MTTDDFTRLLRISKSSLLDYGKPPVEVQEAMLRRAETEQRLNDLLRSEPRKVIKIMIDT